MARVRFSKSLTERGSWEGGGEVTHTPRGNARVSYPYYIVRVHMLPSPSPSSLSFSLAVTVESRIDSRRSRIDLFLFLCLDFL